MTICNVNNPCPPIDGSCGIEYKGARYVPIFANPAEWDINKSYDSLTIVIHQGNSYTSKTIVPIGVDITNLNYWALTGNYNAQVESYRNEVRSFDQRIINNTNDIVTAKNDIITLKKDTNFRGKNVIFVGDSWGTLNYGVTKPYFQITSEILGFNLINLSVGSTGYTTANSFYSRLKDWYDKNPNLRDSINYIMVSGGLNDYLVPNSTLISAIVSFVNSGKLLFPNAEIILIPQIGSADLSISGLSSSVTTNIWIKSHYCCLSAYSNNNLNCTLLRGGLYLFFNFPDTYFNEDKIHPNQKGHNYISKWLTNKLSYNNPFTSEFGNGYFSDVTTKSSVGIVETFKDVEISGHNYIKDDRLFLTYSFTISPLKTYSSFEFEIKKFAPLIANTVDFITAVNSSGTGVFKTNLVYTDGNPSSCKLNCVAFVGGYSGDTRFIIKCNYNTGYGSIV